MELFLKDISPLWVEEFAKPAKRKVIFTPYLTSDTAETVVGGCAAGVCEIYTVFSVELFATGASSLKTLRALMNKGHRLFHLAGLHAKLFLIPGAFASIGSQNLTWGGTRNREASAVTRRPELLKSLEHDLVKWTDERAEISAEMVEDMEDILGDIEPLYRAARQAFEAGEMELLARAQARREAAERQRLLECFRELITALHARRIIEAEKEAARLAAEEKRLALDAELQRHREEAERQRQAERAAQRRNEQEAQARRNRLSALQKNIGTANRSLQTAYAKITTIHNYETGNEQVTLKEKNGRDLRQWQIGNRKIEFEQGRRYLLLQEQGKLGWGRVVKTRISYIGKGVSWSFDREDYLIAGRYFKIRMEADWQLEPKFGRNIFFVVTDGNDITCEVSCWFSLNEIEILVAEPFPSADAFMSDRQEFLSHFHANSDAFKAHFTSLITTPFNYTSPFTGIDPSDFFTAGTDDVFLRAALVQGRPILLTNSI